MHSLMFLVLYTPKSNIGVQITRITVLIQRPTKTRNIKQLTKVNNGKLDVSSLYASLVKPFLQSLKTLLLPANNLTMPIYKTNWTI